MSDLFTKGWFYQPKFRHVFKFRDGTVHHLHPRDAKRILDKRAPGFPPEVCWEITINGIVRRYWPEDILMWEQEPL